MRKSNKLASRDYLTIGLYTVADFAVSAVFSMLTVPILLWFFPYATAFVLFFTCPIYLLMAYKVGKKGTLFLFGAINGLIYAVMGSPFVLPFVLIGSLVGEILLAKTNGYRKLAPQTAAFCIYNLLYGFCNYFVLALSADYYFESMQIEGAMREAYTKYMTQPFWIVTAVAALLVAIVLGCRFGYRLLKKHFLKAGLVAEAV